MSSWKIQKVHSDEVISEENLTDKSFSIRFKGIQEHFSNLSNYIVALDKDYRVVEVLEKGCSREEQEAFFRKNTLCYVGEANKYGFLCGISYPDYVADKMGKIEIINEDGVAEAFFFQIMHETA